MYAVHCTPYNEMVVNHPSKHTESRYSQKNEKRLNREKKYYGLNRVKIEEINLNFISDKC